MYEIQVGAERQNGFMTYRGFEDLSDWLLGSIWLDLGIQRNLSLEDGGPPPRLSGLD